MKKETQPPVIHITRRELLDIRCCIELLRKACQEAPVDFAGTGSSINSELEHYKWSNTWMSAYLELDTILTDKLKVR